MPVPFGAGSQKSLLAVGEPVYENQKLMLIPDLRRMQARVKVHESVQPRPRADAVRQTVARKSLVLGLQEFSRRDLESVRKAGSKLRIHVLGLVRIAADVSPALARDTIESVEVLGALHASPAVKAALADRIL